MKRKSAYIAVHSGLTTHLVMGILVGAGIQQKPHAVRATLLSSLNQCRRPRLRRKYILTRKIYILFNLMEVLKTSKKIMKCGKIEET